MAIRRGQDPILLSGRNSSNFSRSQGRENATLRALPPTSVSGSPVASFAWRFNSLIASTLSSSLCSRPTRKIGIASPANRPSAAPAVANSVSGSLKSKSTAAMGGGSVRGPTGRRRIALERRRLPRLGMGVSATRPIPNLLSADWQSNSEQGRVVNGILVSWERASPPREPRLSGPVGDLKTP